MPKRVAASLVRFLGLATDATPGAAGSGVRSGAGSGSGSGSEQDAGDTDSVRRIASQLERLDASRAKYLAAFAYVLARIAHADLDIDAAETSEMERSLAAISDLSEGERALVVEIAKSQARLLGGTENYVVTREFRAISTPEQRWRLLQCLYAVAAADGSISTIESSELVAIAEELGFTRTEANALRRQYREKLSVLQPKS